MAKSSTGGTLFLKNPAFLHHSPLLLYYTRHSHSNIFLPLLTYLMERHSYLHMKTKVLVALRLSYQLSLV